jgi:hypothetical protein
MVLAISRPFEIRRLRDRQMLIILTGSWFAYYWHAKFQPHTKIFCDCVVIEHSISGWQFAPYAMRFYGTQVLLATWSEIIP